MKRYLWFIPVILIATTQKAFCTADAVGLELNQSLKTHTGEPSVLTIVSALFMVIALIYITGLIYSKLNIVGAKTLHEQFKSHDLSKAIVISTTQLGQNKNLHVIELNHKRYLIGATPNSINLIKELGEGTKKAEKVEKQPEPTFDDAIEVLYGDEQEEPAAKLESVKDFDIHKKYL